MTQGEFKEGSLYFGRGTASLSYLLNCACFESCVITLPATFKGGNILRHALTKTALIVCTLSLGMACGGGGGTSPSVTPEPAPVITQFSADTTSVFRGESATLGFHFANGAGTITPNIGSVISGSTVTVSPLHSTTYTLTIQSPGGLKTSQSITIKALLPSEATGTPAAAHTRYGAVTEAGGTILIVGGVADGSTRPDLVERWDPASGRFSTIGNLLRIRAGGSASALPDGRILVVGGILDQSAGQSMELFDPALGRSSSEITLPRPFVFHTATTLLDGSILLVGGQGSGLNTPFEYGTAYIYDPIQGTLNPTGSLAYPRSAHVARRLSDGRVLIIGGAASGQRHPTLVEVYDPATGSFSVLGQISSPRYQFAAQILGDGKLLLAGGWGASGPALAMELFNPANGTSTQLGSLQRGRVELALWPRDDGKVVIAGGFEPNSITPLQAFELWDPSTPLAGTRSYGVMLSKQAAGNPLIPTTGSRALLLSGGEPLAEVLSSVPPEAP